MAKTQKQNSNQVSNGGQSLSGSNYSNATLTNGNGLTYSTATTAIWTDPFYAKQPKINITDKDIVLDGLSLREFMQSVNKRMAIMQPNPKLEEEFEELRACADRYRELERKLLEQQAMWETLKKTDDK